MISILCPFQIGAFQFKNSLTIELLYPLLNYKSTTRLHTNLPSLNSPIARNRFVRNCCNSTENSLEIDNKLRYKNGPEHKLSLKTFPASPTQSLCEFLFVLKADGFGPCMVRPAARPSLTIRLRPRAIVVLIRPPPLLTHTQAYVDPFVLELQARRPIILRRLNSLSFLVFVLSARIMKCNN